MNKIIKLSTRTLNALENCNISQNVNDLKKIIESGEITFGRGDRNNSKYWDGSSRFSKKTGYFYKGKEMKNFGHKSYQELCKFLGKKPHLFCKYCNGTGIRKAII